jgi:hypothetical protein
MIYSNLYIRFVLLALCANATFLHAQTPLKNKPSKRPKECPDFVKAKETREGKKPKEDASEGAKILRGTNVIKFNVIKLSEKKLDIPAFKQFQNNMTDFTADGEAEFKLVVKKIHDYLGTNTNGAGVTLEVIGSASQIPTSFDPTKPNNNIQPDGSSIPGKTTIENNKQLALARATELGKKIKLVFPEIQLKIPTLSEIKLGTTPWDAVAQKKLNAATVKKDEKAIDAIHEPYQKEQYVMVRSKEYKTEHIQPEALTTHYVTVSPPIAHTENGKEILNARFIVSEPTYHKVGGALIYETVEERDLFLFTELKLSVYHPIYLNQEHWMLLTDNEAVHVSEPDDYKKVSGFYKDKVFDIKDKVVLEDIIVTEILKSIK